MIRRLICLAVAITTCSLRAEDQKPFIELNAELARAWPSITKTKAPLAEAEDWKDTTDKLQYLER